jgi:ubiquinone/menaquinone biosynthesis C-methylase UbiE
MTLYDAIGKEYNNTRKPDRRIVNRLVELLDLPSGSLIADIGAGTGSYSNALADRGYRVIAIKPSLVMQHQAIRHPNVSWIEAVAKQISLPDNRV